MQSLPPKYRMDGWMDDDDYKDKTRQDKTR
jgi:hypothetical protein